jgi:disulfide bond formation protein DsbB
MTLFFSILTVIGQVIIISLIFSKAIRGKAGNKAVLFSFITALIAITGSLIFSEVLKFEPCTLCWYQRIFMYPQVVLLGLALWKKDKNIANYSIALSVIGAIIAAYHYFLQISVISKSFCSIVGYSVSCTDTFAPIFGYITIPMMSFTAFVMIILFFVI